MPFIILAGNWQNILSLILMQQKMFVIHTTAFSPVHLQHLSPSLQSFSNVT